MHRPAWRWLPWRQLRRRYAVLTGVRVSGLRYLDARARAPRRRRSSWARTCSRLDLSRVRQRVLMDPRIERADVRRMGLRGLDVRVVERVPALAVAHGEPWEIDTAGVLLEPLQAGVVADVPLLTGADFSAYRPGLADSHARRCREDSRGRRFWATMRSGSRARCPRWTSRRNGRPGSC